MKTSSKGCAPHRLFARQRTTPFAASSRFRSRAGESGKRNWFISLVAILSNEQIICEAEKKAERVHARGRKKIFCELRKW